MAHIQTRMGFQEGLLARRERCRDGGRGPVLIGLRLLRLQILHDPIHTMLQEFLWLWYIKSCTILSFNSRRPLSRRPLRLLRPIQGLLGPIGVLWGPIGAVGI